MQKRGSSLPIQFKRLYDGPLDVDSIFESMDEAKAYLVGGTAYSGQILSIKVGNSYDIYIINANNELIKYSSGGSGSSSIDDEKIKELEESLEWQQLK